MSKLKDLIGKKFGKLTVIKRAENDKRGNARWLCKCDCGNEIITLGYPLTKGITKACGCLKGNKNRHGFYKHRLYHIWSNICQRCSNPHNIGYKIYGARGITVCNEWKNDFMNFYNWSMENGYRDDLTIDRINVNGNYEPNNCRWVDYKSQARNR